jgi:hypothetical protein
VKDGCGEANIGISIRALWEQMEELIDLLDQVSAVFNRVKDGCGEANIGISVGTL